MRVEYWAGAYILTCFWFLASLGTSVVHCIKAAEWLLLIAVCIFPPAGVVHGTGLWFGLW